MANDMTSADLSKPLPLEELANAYCLMMANAYRLIEDGEKLAAAGRPLGAIGCFQSASTELVRGHMISKAVLLPEDDAAAWKEWWATFNDRARLLAVLENEIHPEIYKSDDSRQRYWRGFALLPLEFINNTFESETSRFLPPGQGLGGLESMEEAAKAYYEYAIGLYHAFNFYGLPNPATQLQTFYGLRMGARNASIVR